MTNDDDRGGGPSPIRLGALEKQVMGLLWDHEPLTVRQIIELSEAEPAYTDHRHRADEPRAQGARQSRASRPLGPPRSGRQPRAAHGADDAGGP